MARPETDVVERAVHVVVEQVAMGTGLLADRW
jgi:hypothetical protein